MNEGEAQSSFSDHDKKMMEGRSSKESFSPRHSRVEGLLASIRNRPENDSGAPKTNFYDVIDIIRAEQGDSKEESKGKPSAVTKALSGYEKTALGIASGQDVPPEKKAKLVQYVESKIASYEEKLRENPKDSTTTANLAILKSLSEITRSPAPTRAAVDASIDAIETFANAHTVDQENEITVKEHAPVELPEYTFVPDKAKAVLADIEKQTTEVTPEQMIRFFEAVQEDITAQEIVYKKDHPEWEDKQNIVQAADMFYQRYKEEFQKETTDKSHRIIFVTKSPDDKLHVGWKPPTSNARGAEYFTFDPAAGNSDPVSLSRHVKNIDQFSNAKFFLEAGKVLINEASSGDALTENERFTLIQLVEAYTSAANQEEQTPEEKAQKKLFTYVKSLKTIELPPRKTVIPAKGNEEDYDLYPSASLN